MTGLWKRTSRTPWHLSLLSVASPHGPSNMAFQGSRLWEPRCGGARWKRYYFFYELAHSLLVLPFPPQSPRVTGERICGWETVVTALFKKAAAATLPPCPVNTCRALQTWAQWPWQASNLSLSFKACTPTQTFHQLLCSDSDLHFQFSPDSSILVLPAQWVSKLAPCMFSSSARGNSSSLLPPHPQSLR